MAGCRVVCWFCALMLASSTTWAAEDWPQFRGPTAQGISTAKNVPIEWSTSKNVAWKLDIPGTGWSSPVLAGGRLYLTAAVDGGNAPPTLRALCIDAAEGKILWNVEVFQPDPGSMRAKHAKNSPASPTPIVTADRLFVHFGHMGTAALDLNGKIIWRQDSLKYSPVHGNGCSPVLADNSLIFSCDGGSNPFIVALDAATGQVKWKTPRNQEVHKTFSFCTPLLIDVDGVSELISPASGMVAAYEPASGHELWRVRYGEGYSVVPRPGYADGMLFVSSGFDNPILYAIKPSGAAGDVTDSHVAWTHRKGAPLTPSMILSGEEIFFVSDGGIATCADAKSGKVHWTHRLDGNFSASPILAEGRIYFQSEQGMGFVIEAGESFKSLAENDFGERSLASYAVTDGALFIRTENHLWKIAESK